MSSCYSQNQRALPGDPLSTPGTHFQVHVWGVLGEQTQEVPSKLLGFFSQFACCYLISLKLFLLSFSFFFFFGNFLFSLGTQRQIQKSHSFSKCKQGLGLASQSQAPRSQSRCFMWVVRIQALEPSSSIAFQGVH